MGKKNSDITLLNVSTNRHQIKILIIGNISSHGYLLKRNLKIDVDVIQFFYNTKSGRTLKKIFDSKNVETYFINSLPEIALKIISRVRKNNYDLILYFNINPFVIRCVQLASLNTPYLIYNTGSGRYGLYESKNCFFWAIVVRPAIMGAKKILFYDSRREKYLRQFTDTALVPQMYDERKFNLTIKKRKKFKNFTFLSLSRMDGSKGHDMLWKAIELAKSDFIVLQTDWGDGNQYEQIKNTAPSKVQFIPLISKEDLPTWLASIDCVLGQMLLGWHGIAELEAAATGIPVTLYINDEAIPFYPKDQKPETLANLIDRLVIDSDFRKKYATEIYNYVINQNRSELVAHHFNKLFLESLENTEKSSGKYFLSILIERILNLGLKLYQRFN